MPEASRTPRLAAIGSGAVACPGLPILETAHGGGFCTVAVVEVASHNASAEGAGEAARSHVFPASLRGGINVAGGKRATTKGSFTTVMSSMKLPSGNAVGVSV